MNHLLAFSLYIIIAELNFFWIVLPLDIIIESSVFLCFLVQVDPSCDYSNITYIVSFDNKFTHCGGINLPKVVTCIGSDGKRRRQLVKVIFIFLLAVPLL